MTRISQDKKAANNIGNALSSKHWQSYATKTIILSGENFDSAYVLIANALKTVSAKKNNRIKLFMITVSKERFGPTVTKTEKKKLI